MRTAKIVLLLIAFLKNAAAHKRQQSIVVYHGAVATDDGRCSEIGMKVLRKGGNAIDASVAAALCLGVVSPGSSGIGGGSFAVVKTSEGKEVAYDSREVAPLRATEVTSFSNKCIYFCSERNMRFKLKEKKKLSFFNFLKILIVYTFTKKYSF